MYYDTVSVPSMGYIQMGQPRPPNSRRRRRHWKWLRRAPPAPVTTIATVSPRRQRFHPRSETGSLLTWTSASSTHKSDPYQKCSKNDDAGSQYSDAEVVDVHDLVDVPSTSERLGRACAEALDMKPSRAAIALDLLPVIASCIGEGEALFVAKWALNNAAYRCDQCALEELSMICSFSSETLPKTMTPPPQPAPEPLIRFVCAEVGSHSALAAATALRAARKWHATEATKSTRVLRVHVPFAVAVLGVICALARTQCAVFRRGRKQLGDSVSLFARLGRSRINVDIVGSEPAVVVVQRQNSWFSGREVREQAEELVGEVSDILSEFADVVVYGR